MPYCARWFLTILTYCSWAVLCLSGCGRKTPELIAVSGLTPDRVEVRDVIAVMGEGFVVGSEAVVELSGTTFRPAQAPEKVNVTARGLAVDSTSLELAITPEFVAAFTGGETGTDSHATFRGVVRVAFVPKLPGAPPIEGRSRELVLDVFGDRSGNVPTAPGSSASASPILGFLGVTVTELGERGLSVVEVAPAKPAFGAGLLAGDTIVSWAGVRVHRASDLEPPPGEKLVQAELTRNTVAGSFPLLVPVEGYTPPPANGWWVGLVLLGLVLIPLFLSRTGVSRWLLWSAFAAAPSASQPSFARPGRRLAIGPFLVVSLVFLGLAAKHRAVPGQVDVVWLAVLVSLTIALSAVAGAHRGSRFSLLALVRLLVRQLPVHLALWGCTLIMVLEHGRASVWELAFRQTLDPRSYGAFVSPVSFMIAGVLAFTAALLALCPYHNAAETPFWRSVAKWGASSGETASLLLVGLVVAVFFGGWATGGEPVRTLQSVEAISFQLKFTACYLVLVSVRLTIAGVPADSLGYFGTRALLPSTMLALACLPVWSADVWPAWVRAGIQTLMLCVAGALALCLPPLWIALRRLAASRQRVAAINPWI